MRRPWMPFYVGDYLGDTEHLSTVQHGAYCLLLFSYWRRGCLPDDDQQLANITRLSMEEWLAQKPALQAFFHDGWTHKRMEYELHRTADLRAKRAAAGQKGGIIASINRFKRRP
jgi:uncharacterized protein YdaU (DUF1376 family)